MAFNYSTIEKLTNTILSPLRIIKDKSKETLKDYINNENTNIKRMYPDKNFIDRLSDYVVFFSEPTPVYPNIYLGSVYNANTWNTLVKNNIKYIINVSNELTNWYPDYIEYYQIPIKDNNSESMQPYFDESYNKIEEFLSKKNGNILVHCFFGASRSVTIITEYLRRKTGKSIDDIIIELKKLRPVVNPSQQFIYDLYINNKEEKENKEENKEKEEKEEKENNFLIY
jgi:protein-tyrosine phosphatase